VNHQQKPAERLSGSARPARPGMHKTSRLSSPSNPCLAIHEELPLQQLNRQLNQFNFGRPVCGLSLCCRAFVLIARVRAIDQKLAKLPLLLLISKHDFIHQLRYYLPHGRLRYSTATSRCFQGTTKLPTAAHRNRFPRWSCTGTFRQRPALLLAHPHIQTHAVI
jgi:hypothetical protein